MAAFFRDNKLFTATFLVLVSLHVALISMTRLLPFTDLPNHLAAATIARYIDDPSNQFSAYYGFGTFLEPNTFHTVFCGFKIFPSVELANRFFFIIYLVLLPFSALLVVRKLGGNSWFSLLSFLLLYNCNVSWGFMGFAFAIPLVMLFYHLFILDARSLESVCGASFAAAFVALIYFVHILAALFCLLLLFLNLALKGARPPRALLGSIIAAAPFLVMLTAWWHGETRLYGGPGTLAFLAQYYRHEYMETFAQRKGVFVFDNCRLFDGPWGPAIALFFSAAVILPAGILLVKRRKGGGSGAEEKGPALAGVFPLLLASLLCCSILPSEIPSQAVLYERFSVFLLLSLMICGAVLASRKLPRAVPAVFAALAILHFILWSDYFIDFNRENAGFNKSFLEPSGSGKKLAGLIYDYKYRGGSIYIHFPSYYIVWEKAVATSKIIDYRFGPVRRTVNGAELPCYLEWVGHFGNYDGRYRMMDYILARGTVTEAAPSFSPTAPMKIPAAYLAGFRPARVSGKWALYERIAAPPPGPNGPKTIDKDDEFP